MRYNRITCADKNAFVRKIIDVFQHVTVIVSLCVSVCTCVCSPVLQISKWMVKMECEREESLFISV